ncbi:hypothetical protein GCM10010466_39790 [Planomonospora alba]|uniref:Uncharacterized protein n=1 Tax=Planomonospora alba TaxID=161354 RepID=A0ABP6NEL3_9ACTN
MPAGPYSLDALAARRISPHPAAYRDRAAYVEDFWLWWALRRDGWLTRAEQHAVTDVLAEHLNVQGRRA